MALNNQLSFVSQPRGRYGVARCARCHRLLTDPASVQAGMGPECRGRSMRGGSGLCRRDQFSDDFDNEIPFEQALVLKRQPSPASMPGPWWSRSSFRSLAKEITKSRE